MPTPRKKSFRDGYVRVSWRADREAWQIAYRCPESGRYVRFTAQAADLETVRAIAREHNRRLLGERETVPTFRTALAPSDPGPTVRDAIMEALRLESRAGHSAMRNMLFDANRFLKWLSESAPEVQHWSALSRGRILEFLKAQGAKSKARLTGLLMPLGIADRYWHREKPELFPRRFTEGIKLPETRPKKDVFALSPEELLSLLEQARTKLPGLFPVFAIAGMAGCRIQEAAAIRYCDVDMEAGTLAIDDTETHAVKTLSSIRTVPMADALKAIMAECLEARPRGNQDAESPVFLSPSGVPWTQNSLILQWKRNRALFEVPAGFVPKSLRATFKTIVESHGASEQLTECYMGHSAGKSIGRKHYRRILPAELLSVAGAMDRAISSVRNYTKVTPEAPGQAA